jgi:hypothetical protein
MPGEAASRDIRERLISIPVCISDNNFENVYKIDERKLDLAVAEYQKAIDLDSDLAGTV